MTLTDGDFPESVVAMNLSANAFEFFGVPMHLGRGFTPEDGLLGGGPPTVVVLGNAFWRSHYGGRADAPGAAGKKAQRPRQAARCGALRGS